MALALFSLAVSSFLVVNAQGLMLRGPPNSVHRCVEILRGHWGVLKVVLGASLVALLAAAISIVWMKEEHQSIAPWPALWCTAVVVVVAAAAACRMARMAREFRIDGGTLVQGDLALGRERQVDLLSEESSVIPVART